MHFVYILYSERLKKYYTGETKNLPQRMEFHNSGKNTFTRKGLPWILIKKYECTDRKEALLLERRIKANGAKRFIERLENTSYK